MMDSLFCITKSHSIQSCESVYFFKILIAVLSLMKITESEFKSNKSERERSTSKFKTTCIIYVIDEKIYSVIKLNSST